MPRALHLAAVLLIAGVLASCSKNEHETVSLTPTDTTTQGGGDTAVAPSSEPLATPAGSAHDLVVDARRLEADLGQALQSGTLDVAGDLALDISNRYAAAVARGSFRTGQRDSLQRSLALVQAEARGLADEARAGNLEGAKEHFRELQPEMRALETIANEHGVGP